MARKIMPPSDEETQVIGAAFVLQLFLPKSPVTAQAKAAAGEIAQRHVQNAATQFQEEVSAMLQKAIGAKPAAKKAAAPQELKMNPRTGAYE